MTLPSELLNLIRQRSGYSILIKGTAGAGKTLLAMEMLLKSPRGMYISSRVSPSALFDHVPGFEEKAAKLKIIDASQTIVSPLWQAVPAKDAIFNALKYQDLPEFVQNLIGEIDASSKSGEGPLLVAIDSWEAVLETKKTDALGSRRVESLLSDIIKLSNVNLILISEQDEKSFLDYLVDAVIYLKREIVNDRILRTLEIRKLRGAQIVHPRYLYTLAGGRFTHFDRFQFKLPEIMIKRPPIADPRPQLMSMGSEKLDRLLHDGIRYGSWMLIEVGNGIGDGFFQFIIPLIVNHLNLNRDLFLVLPEGINIFQFEKLHVGFTGQDKFSKHVTVYEMFSPESMEGVQSKVESIDPDPEAMFKKMHDRLMNAGVDNANPPLLVLGLDTLELLYPEKKFLKSLVTNISFTKNFLNVTVALAKEEQACVKTLSHLCTMHWKIELVNESMVIRGIQPITGYNGVRARLKEGFINLDLTPIT
jgi:KaiC/GvpD/RAD55 family RecA-like ATPase